ncbi:hypothetical protein [Cellvibrio polysaccharolyticus]|uniref:GTPase n=1 Tax=Cellvibrio polysaccharolyticus TaxID=2082724 RepID=A0A928YVL4_9GAMM|nr:hypothetical protein [Cellvibrio polysaccharolyticus]MBE8718680.1 hypothetical protein [Cellvibrio polysaccharolyticus]
MFSDNDSLNLLLALKLPSQEQAQLSFCHSNKPAALQDWLDQLPHTQARVISTHFYRALPELARLKIPVTQRIALLDSVWDPLTYCLTGLAKDFLNQPVILPEAARKTATLAQALQKHASQGWLVALRELCSNILNDEARCRALMALCIHRALTSHAAFMLRSWQLYIPVPPSLWQEAHLLYRIAEAAGIARNNVSRPDSDLLLVGNIEQIYVRILLLASARPNQLRQDELGQVWQALIGLGNEIGLQPYDATDNNSLFVADISGDQPPAHPSRQPGVKNTFWRQPAMGAIQRFISDMLPATAASEALAENPLRSLRPPLSIALLRHLHQAWYVLAKRRDDRQSTQGHIEVTIGLSNLHYHLSNKTPFDVFLEQVDMMGGKTGQSRSFQQRGIQLKTAAPAPADDPWSTALDAIPYGSSGKGPDTSKIDAAIRQHHQGEYQGHHPTYQVPLLDASENGYCLEWQGEIPAQVKAGELLGLKPDTARHWRIGVIRWVQQTPGATQLGIQILAPLARPVALATIHKTGDFTEYLRGLQLPAQRLSNQPGTLITNAVSFRESYKVRLFVPATSGANNGNTEKAAIAQSLQLAERLFSTGAFSQFTFRPIATLTSESSQTPVKK